MSNGKAVVEVWTDGSCYPNPGGPGGWAAIIIGKLKGVTDEEITNILKTSVAFNNDEFTYKSPPGTKVRWKARILRGGLPEAKANTNNRMEVMAIMEAFRAMKPCKVTVVTDSQYAIGLLSGRNRAKKNVDQKLQFLTLSTGFDIIWKHIHGHGSGTPNVIADLLAGEAANEFRKQATED